MKTKPINISEEARVAAIYERDRSYPCGYHVQQFLNAETEKLRNENIKLRKENEELKARIQQMCDEANIVNEN